MDLTRAKVIAFDLDGTLVDGIASDAIAAYINANPTQPHHIVTFRTQRQIGDLDTELASVGLRRDQFQQVVCCPMKLDLEWQEDVRMRRNSGRPALNGSTAKLMPGEFKYVHWKGFVAHKLGATILVDDLPNLVTPGCRLYKVTYLDVRDFPATLARAA